MTGMAREGVEIKKMQFTSETAARTGKG